MLAAAALVVAGCGTDDNTGDGGSGGGGGGHILGAGSSFQDPMEQAWIQGFASSASPAPDVQIQYNPIGSGDGISQFGNGTTNYAGSDVLMSPDEQSAADDQCGSPAIHIPVTAGGVGVTYNLDGVDDLNLSASTIADIFTGKVKKWNDDEIAGDNPDAELPDSAIHVFTRADDSGTTAVFTAYMSAAAPDEWTLGSDKHIDWPTGQGKQQSAGVAGAVKQTNGGITYVEEAFAEQQGLSLANVKNKSGKYVALDADAVSTALTTATPQSNGANDLSYALNFTPSDPKAYPISTVSYVIVCTTYPSSFDSVDELKGYLDYAVTTGQDTATELGFAPLPASLVTKAKASIAAIG
jgi:phosphate transport system substrate-binding protein